MTWENIFLFRENQFGKKIFKLGENNFYGKFFFIWDKIIVIKIKDLFNNGNITFQTNTLSTSTTNTNFIKVQLDDGHFVIYSSVGYVAKWSNGKFGQGWVSGYIVLQDTGKLNIFDQTGSLYWAN